MFFDITRLGTISFDDNADVAGVLITAVFNFI